MFRQTRNRLIWISFAIACSESLLINPVSTETNNCDSHISSKLATSTRTFMSSSLCIKTPDPIPVEGQLEALELMKTGRLYRYGVQRAEDSVVSLCEKEIAEYTGHKYCIALNSCGSALMLLLKTTGLKHGEKVLSNAFTFGAVPSAIEHAGGKVVYVESTLDMTIDIADFEKKLQTHPDCRHVLISHMRGKVANMQAIEMLCKKHDTILLEDCAHSLGVFYQHRHSGHSGIACAISSQSYKMINSGEGGFLLTNDPDIAAQCAVYAGAYEALSSKHITVPPQRYFKNYPNTLPNYSLRMSQLAASVIRPQIRSLEARISTYNRRYKILQSRIETKVGDHVFIPKLTPEVTRMVHDSLQFNLDSKFSDKMVDDFIQECFAHGLHVELFGHHSNARNFVNWGFAPAEDPLPKTSAMLARACDIRMPLMWHDEDFNDMANVIIESVEKVLLDHSFA
jgi:dTDP-4-amino-4,6-dideoxygalactose transaminase